MCFKLFSVPRHKINHDPYYQTNPAIAIKISNPLPGARSDVPYSTDHHWRSKLRVLIYKLYTNLKKFKFRIKICTYASVAMRTPDMAILLDSLSRMKEITVNYPIAAGSIAPTNTCETLSKSLLAAAKYPPWS